MRLPTAALTAVFAAATLAVDADAQHRRTHRPAAEASVAPTTPPAIRIERDIAYGDHAKQRFDAYLPRANTDGAPIVVMVHGGGWRIGDKDNPGLAADKAAHWVSKGYVFVSTNYRLLPEADPLGQARDVASALAAVQARARRWGADPRRVVLMGHSAGAHLVALLGASPSMLAQAGAAAPAGVVALDGAALDVPRLMDRPRRPRVYHDAFGDDPAYWHAASPLQQLGARSLPMLLVCSTRRAASCPQAEALRERARRLGVAIEVQPRDLTHAQINRELGRASEYTDAVSAWIDRLLD